MAIVRKFFSGWVLAALFLIIVIAAGSFVIGNRLDRFGPLEIVFQPAPAWTGDIYLGDGVTVPGWYPFSAGDTVGDLIDAAGGYSGDEPLRLELVMLFEKATPQKININTAEGWLLRALPGIGETRAQAIIDYRTEYGWFRDVDELMKVEGIGPGILESLRHYVTVGE